MNIKKILGRSVLVLVTLAVIFFIVLGKNDRIPSHQKIPRQQKEVQLSSLAVLLIDMQPCFVDVLRTGAAQRIIPAQIEVIKLCAQFDIPLIILEYLYHGKTIPKLQKWIKKVPRTIIVEKWNDDGFQETNLLEELQKLKIESLLLMGINADHCVRDTSISAINNKFQIITSQQLIAGQSHHSSNDSLDYYKKYGIVKKDIIFFIHNLSQVLIVKR